MLLTALAALQVLTPIDSPPDDFDRRVTPEVRVVRAAGPAVVYIRTNVYTRVNTWFGPRDRVQQGSGSGVVIYEDGYIVTNNHVVSGAQKIEVFFNSDPGGSNKGYPAHLVSAKPNDDLALIKIDAEGPFPTVPLGTSRDLMIAERVLAIGNPYGQTHTVSAGIISGLHRELNTSGIRFRNLIQTDASINPGNSGGPLLNINGELIGINTVMNSAAENIGFAIPVDHVREVLREHLLAPDKAKTWLGYELDLANLTVTSVVPGCPADVAGIRAGDRIVEIAGGATDSEDQYRFARVLIEPRRPVAFAVERGSERLDVELVGWPRMDGILYERLGFLVEPVVFGTYDPYRTVAVSGLRPDGPGAKLGLKKGDFLRHVRPPRSRTLRIRDAEDLAILVSRMEAKEVLEMEIWRDEDKDGRLMDSGPGSELFTGGLLVD